MILPIFGTIRNTVKMAELNNKWEQKKKNGGKEMKKEMDPQMKQILQYKEDLKRMRESNQMASIDAKLNSGGILTPEEITYLLDLSADLKEKKKNIDIWIKEAYGIIKAIEDKEKQ